MIDLFHSKFVIIMGFITQYNGVMDTDGVLCIWISNIIHDWHLSGHSCLIDGARRNRLKQQRPRREQNNTPILYIKKLLLNMIIQNIIQIICIYLILIAGVASVSLFRVVINEFNGRPVIIFKKGSPHMLNRNADLSNTTMIELSCIEPPDDH